MLDSARDCNRNLMSSPILTTICHISGVDLGDRSPSTLSEYRNGLQIKMDALPPHELKPSYCYPLALGIAIEMDCLDVVDPVPKLKSYIGYIHECAERQSHRGSNGHSNCVARLNIVMSDAAYLIDELSLI